MYLAHVQSVNFEANFIIFLPNVKYNKSVGFYGSTVYGTVCHSTLDTL